MDGRLDARIHEGGECSNPAVSHWRQFSGATDAEAIRVQSELGTATADIIGSGSANAHQYSRPR